MDGHLTNVVGRDVKWAKQHSALQLLSNVPGSVRQGDV